MCSVSRDEEATLSDFIVEGVKIDFAIVGEVKRAELRLGSILFRLQIPGQFALCFRGNSCENAARNLKYPENRRSEFKMKSYI